MATGRIAYAALAALSALLWVDSARAIDLVLLAKQPVGLEVTETTIVAQHFGARTGEEPGDQGYFAWLNRLNVALSWWRFTLGLRLDSSVYGNRPEDQPVCDGKSLLPCLTPQQGTPSQRLVLQADEASRYRDGLYPAKVWLSYAAPGLEVTAGDAYVQFGRGLILAMRKIDELGLDTTLRGGKIAWQADPFALTIVAGIANPARVDEATGRALFLPVSAPGMPPSQIPGTTTAQPLFGSDRILGAEVQAGRGLPVLLSTHGVRLTRCAPVHYAPMTRDPYDGPFDAPLGSCDPTDTQIWLATLPTAAGPVINASEVDMIGQGLELPNLWGHAKLYAEGALQRRYHDSFPLDPNATGNALYASLSADAGPVTNTLEVKSFRNFYPLAGAVDTTHAIEFANVAYSIPPTTEAVTQDSELGFFSACVDGGRLRTNVRVGRDLLVYGTAAYYHSKSEVDAGGCDAAGHTLSGGLPAAAVETYVWDGVGGIEWFFDDHLSHLFASTGVRDDVTGQDVPFYHELHAEYAFTKHLVGPYSAELTGRHRLRYEQDLNGRGPNGASEPWHEGDNYVALKVSPKYVVSQGFEYTTLLGQPTYYFNGAARYNFRSDSSVVLFVGEQRGGLRCVSGVCKVFPAFEGARMEVTVRF
jgi:hypothetical protein